MESFHSTNYFLPLLTSVTGILFWTTLCTYLEPVFAANTIVNFISNNTFFIMANHLFFYNLVNGFINLLNVDGFDVYTFQTTAWYKYMPIQQFGVLYILFAIICTFFINFVLRKYFGGKLQKLRFFYLKK